MNTYNICRYFANILFAQLITTSPHLIPIESKKRILQFMEEFLEVADHNEIREEEVRNGYKWSTLVPFMKLVYHPYARERSAQETDDQNKLDDEDRLRLDRSAGKKKFTLS